MLNNQTLVARDKLPSQLLLPCMHMSCSSHD